MSFFELPAPPPEPPEERAQPVWLGPPDNVFGASFPLHLVLARTEAVALQVHTGMAYPTGIEFSLQLLQRERSRGHERDPIHTWHMIRRDGAALAPEVLRFGIAFADGRKATVFDERHFGREDGLPPAVLMQRGGSGGDRRYDVRFWLWPLPPAGPLAFVVEWPAQGIELARHEVDTAPLSEAAGHAKELWPEGRPSTGTGNWRSHVMTARSTANPSE